MELRRFVPRSGIVQEAQSVGAVADSCAQWFQAKYDSTDAAAPWEEASGRTLAGDDVLHCCDDVLHRCSDKNNGRASLRQTGARGAVVPSLGRFGEISASFFACSKALCPMRRKHIGPLRSQEPVRREPSAPGEFSIHNALKFERAFRTNRLSRHSSLSRVRWIFPRSAAPVFVLRRAS